MNWMKRILKWPAKPTNCRLPLCISAWRLLWLVPIFASVLLTCAFIAIGFGWDAAVNHWKDAQ